ncbi:TnsA endonuclease N terminal [Ralstonia sp. UNCCL144]|nr:TnsA endonuclease N terminal [Ralstonia sp. UNCCL144]
MLSDNELHFFLYADFAKEVVDIREQFPLFPQEETAKLAEDLGISHPRYPGTSTLTVITTDFLLTIRHPEGNLEYSAYSIKSSEELQGPERKRTLEKLQLERQYWLARGIRWQLFTDREFDRVRITNIEWLSYLSHLEPTPLAHRIPEFLRFVQNRWRRKTPLFALLEETATALPGTTLADVDQLFRYCVWQHLIEIDMTRPIGPRCSITVLYVSTIYDSNSNEADFAQLSSQSGAGLDARH